MDKLNTLIKSKQSWGEILLNYGELPMSSFPKMKEMCQNAGRRIYIHYYFKNPEVIVYYGICKKIYPTVSRLHSETLDTMDKIFYTNTCIHVGGNFEMPKWSIDSGEVRVNLSNDNKLQIDDGRGEFEAKKLPKKYHGSYMNDESCYNLYVHYRRNKFKLP